VTAIRRLTLTDWERVALMAAHNVVCVVLAHALRMGLA